MEVFEKSQTVDPEVRAYVYSLVSAIGGSSAADDGRYVLGDDALACLKDLRRWLKLYDEKLGRHDVKRCLAEANLIKGDLLEILGQWREDDHTNVLRKKIAIGCLELLCQLAWPIHIDAERATVNHLRHLPVIQLAQVDYKRSILHHESSAILHKAIAAAVPALTTPRKERSPRDVGIINLVLYLFRNIVMINHPPNLPSQGDEEDISRSETIRALQEQDVLSLILTICSGMGDEFDEQDVIVMELLFHLVKGVDPKRIFKNDDQVKNDDVDSFKKLLLAEKAMLASQARNAPSRHNRFGTMLWVKQDDDEKVATMTGQDLIGNNQKTFEKMDATKKWNKPKHHARNADVRGDGTDFAPVHLDQRSRTYLKNFISEFLDSSFNPLFLHLRKALEREVSRVKEDHARQYFYLVSWFLKAEEARRQYEKGDAQQGVDAVETPFAYVAGVLTQETFVLLNRNMQRGIDDKAWADVHTCLLAFTQIMLTVSAMSESPSEDDQEIAENIQSRIFYEEQTHDRILQVLRLYHEGRQDFPFLDAATELAHVFIRLLERYSKVNVDMFIRSKRRARRKANAKPKGPASIEGLENDQPQNEDDGANDEVEAHQAVQERKFDFGRFAAKFVNESSVNTFIALLGRYRDLTEEQLKRCHRFFYRVAFKMELPILLYRVDILNLFNRMAKGPNGLESIMDRKKAQYKEWEELIKQIFRRCVKKLEERPELIVEMLFTKIPSALFYLEHGYEKVVKSAPRPPAELEVKPGIDHTAQIGVVVSVLVNQGKLDALSWVKTVMMAAIEERQSWEAMQPALEEAEAQKRMEDATIFGDGNSNDKEKPDSADTNGEQSDRTEGPRAPSIIVKPDSEERRIATYKDKHLRLLLKTLAFQRLGSNDDADASWIIPSELAAQTIEADLDAIRNFEFDPPSYEEGKSAESFIRSEATARRNAYEKEASDDDGDSDVDEGLFVPGGPTRRPDDPREEKPKKRRKLRRKGEEITEEERQERANARRKREKDKDAKIKSSLFVTESDDEEDEERDADFFRMEAQRRGNAANLIKTHLMDGRTGHGEERESKAAKRKSKTAQPIATKRRRTGPFDEDSDTEMLGVTAISSRESSPGTESSLIDTEEPPVQRDEHETPLSSQTAQQDDDRGRAKSTPLRVVSGNEQMVDEDGDEDDVVAIKSTARGRRSLFVIDDDDSE